MADNIVPIIIDHNTPLNIHYLYHINRYIFRYCHACLYSYYWKYYYFKLTSNNRFILILIVIEDA
ncbi:hypothetical protein XBO1_1710001 [Xenorhabdus bovienii str. oregonense]|uniref:Uncharacterized protein n=1 Tax=Xenorhabdus bovienii str. oregonense TaxID=1398202 RepID=A0A077P1X6_XENBV|nr:hypothetical protein XBO1_1710001 [Xenorhabdus bovienii str. oregonense]